MTRFDDPVVPSRSAFRTIRGRPGLFVAATVVTSLMLCLAVAVLVADQATRDLVARAAGDIRLSAFLDPQVTRADAEAMRSRIESASVVSRATLRTREDAWSAVAGRGMPVLTNRPNPLPDAWIVALRFPEVGSRASTVASEVDAAKDAVASIPGVASVTYDRAWVGFVDRWSVAVRWSAIVRWSVVGSIAVLLFCVFFVTGRAWSANGGSKGARGIGVSAASVGIASVVAAVASYLVFLALPTSLAQPLADAATHAAVLPAAGVALALIASAIVGGWAGSVNSETV